MTASTDYRPTPTVSTIPAECRADYRAHLRRAPFHRGRELVAWRGKTWAVYDGDADRDIRPHGYTLTLVALDLSRQARGVHPDDVSGGARATLRQVAELLGHRIGYHDTGAPYVATRDARYWSLTDYVVSSVTSGPTVWLRPRTDSND